MTTLRLKTNQYAIAALKDRRATLAGEIEQFKQGIIDRDEMLSHLDATLRALDPSYRADTIAAQEAPPREAVRRRGVEPADPDALRKTDGQRPVQRRDRGRHRRGQRATGRSPCPP